MSEVKYKKIKYIGLLIGLLFCVSACGQNMEQSDETQTETIAAENAEDYTEDQENSGLTKESLILEEGERTIYAEADASGNVKEVRIETFMKDEDGEEFRYKEETDEALPVEVAVSYYLNDEQILPENLAGKSGKVKIRFDYKNVSAEEEFVPFTAISTLVLPSDIFTNVEVVNGEIISMEGQNLAVGYALPGVSEYLKLETYEPTEDLEIPEYVEITADVTDFELEFTATVITNGLFEDLEEEDLNDFDELTESMSELSDASRELADGTGELYDGMKEFHSCIIDFAEAIGAVSEGTGALSDGLKALNDNKGELKNGAESLNAGLTTLNNSLKKSIEDLTKKLDAENPEQDNAGANETIQPTEAELALMQMIETLSEVQSGVQLLLDGSGALLEGVEGFNDGISELYEGSAELQEGTEELFGASIDLNDGFVEIVDGVKELKEGFEEFDREGIKELEKMAGSELEALIDRLRILKENDTNWNGFTGDAKNSEPVRMILETEEIK